MFTKSLSASARAAGRHPSRPLRAWRLALYRYRRLAWVPEHLHKDIIDEARRR